MYLPNFLQRIFNYYNAANGSYQEEVQRANANVARGDRFQFNSNLPPYFYSGQLFVQQGESFIVNPNVSVLFLTMNPQENEHVNRWDPGTVTHNDFIERMNNWFISQEANERRPSNIYSNCQAFLKEFVDAEDFQGRYELLHTESAVALDWFPFYSPEFKFKNIADWNGLPMKYLNHILSLVDDIPDVPIIAVGGAIKTALVSMGTVNTLGDNVTKVELVNKSIYCIPKLAVPGVGRGADFLDEVVNQVRANL